MKKRLTNFLIMLLFVIAVFVFVSVVRSPVHAAEWRLIALYWAVLSFKNWFDIRW